MSRIGGGEGKKKKNEVEGRRERSRCLLCCHLLCWETCPLSHKNTQCHHSLLHDWFKISFDIIPRKWDKRVKKKEICRKKCYILVNEKEEAYWLGGRGWSISFLHGKHCTRTLVKAVSCCIGMAAILLHSAGFNLKCHIATVGHVWGKCLRKRLQPLLPRRAITNLCMLVGTVKCGTVIRGVSLFLSSRARTFLQSEAGSHFSSQLIVSSFRVKPSVLVRVRRIGDSVSPHKDGATVDFSSTIHKNTCSKWLLK